MHVLQVSILPVLGGECRIKVRVQHGYGQIFLSFPIYLEGKTSIPMSVGYVLDTGYFKENEELE